ncbi:Hypothetical protein NCS54_00521900 [Fusarium falciforme]|uniref:Hypothetical protein n=1 Tax=Fusarium falciforme TaxID=195108 RepID=UPI0023003AF1|nr:Hypothetical protein NCS54_00521900 [Fusarium falciforme]WAO87896.1 Hypothetical protein NCS54_00521900 [Fusarium falciforme]
MVFLEKRSSSEKKPEAASPTVGAQTTSSGVVWGYTVVSSGQTAQEWHTEDNQIQTTTLTAIETIWVFLSSAPADTSTPASQSDASAKVSSTESSIATSSSEADADGVPPKTSLETNSASNPTSTSTSAPAKDGNDNRLAGGAVAGIAIACIVAGIALGAAAMFLLFRRRRRQSQANFHQVSNGGIEPKKDVMVTVTPSKNDVDLNQFLLDTIPDKQIEGELHALSELLYQHVESHYHRSPVHLDAQTLAQSLVHIGYSPAASGLDEMTVVALCLEPSSRPVGLRHVLSHVIFSSLDFSSGSNMAMLPPVVREFLSTIPSAESNGTAPATSLALSKWRSLSTLLLHPTPADRTPLPVPVAEASQQAGGLANELNSFLRFFAPQDAAGSQEQTSHLQAVILECTKLGYILLSQPSDWRFVFSDKQSRRVVVCPGLEKLSHSDGTRYRSPREVVAVVTMPI